MSQSPFQQPAAHDRFTHGRIMILEKKTRGGGGGIINLRLNKLSVKNKLNVREYKKPTVGSVPSLLLQDGQKESSIKDR